MRERVGMNFLNPKGIYWGMDKYRRYFDVMA
jgi:hypothetical protein